MDRQADLHIHSFYSDGLCAPDEIVDRARVQGLSAIAITDHDSVDGVDPSRTAARGRIEIIPAVELSANVNATDVHILGYYIDHRHPELTAFLADFKAFRIKRAQRILQKLAADGVNVDFEYVRAIGGRGSIGRPHIAEALRQCGYVHTIGEAFVRYLGYHSPYYEPKKSIRPAEVINRIKQCRGISVIAHPGALHDDTLIYRLIADGVMGIEIWHPEHSRQQESQYTEIALKNGLLMTGGSDFHGFPHSHVEIGSQGCSAAEVARLKEFKNEQGGC